MIHSNDSFDFGGFNVSKVLIDIDGKTFLATASNINEILKKINHKNQLNMKPKEMKRNKRNLLDINERNFDFSFAKQIEIVGPRCIPLKSKNIEANPYHPSLLSKPVSETRTGLGLPQMLDSLTCSQDLPSPCSISLSKSQEIRVGNSYSISLEDSKSYTKNMGTSNTRGKSNSYTHSIGNSFERSRSNSLSFSSEESFSDQLTDTLTKSHETSSGVTSTKSIEISSTDSISQDITQTNSVNTEITGSRR